MSVENSSIHWSTSRVVLLVLGLAAVAIASTYLVISRRESRKLDAAIHGRVATYHAAGEPVTIAELRTTPVPDEDNAVIELRQALAMLNGPGSHNAAWAPYFLGDRGYPMTSKERRLAGQAVLDNAAVFGLVDKAMAKNGVYWPNQPTSPLIEFLLPDLSQRSLASFLDMAAMFEHDRGHDTAALLDIHRILFVEHALEHHPQMMVVAMVAGGMRGLAAETVRKIAPVITIGDSPSAVSPTAVAALIHELLDEDEATRTFRTAILAERVMYIDTADAVASGRMDLSKLTGASQSSSTPFQLFKGPYFSNSSMRGDLPILLDAATEAGNAVMCSDWLSAQAKLGNLHNALGKDVTKHPFARLLMPSFSRTIEIRFRTEADCRTAATMLAVRWYEAEHNGVLPLTLNALLPKYLRAVPRDPFTPGAEAQLRYIASGTDPRIYTLCPDGTDNGGHDRDTNGKQLNSYHRPAAIAHLRPQPRDLSQLPAELKN